MAAQIEFDVHLHPCSTTNIATNFVENTLNQPHTPDNLILPLLLACTLTCTSMHHHTGEYTQQKTADAIVYFRNAQTYGDSQVVVACTGRW